MRVTQKDIPLPSLPAEIPLVCCQLPSLLFILCQVLTWAKQHQQRLEAALSELVANAELLEELLAWIQWAETTLIQRDQEPMPQNIDQVKALIAEHQVTLPWLAPSLPPSRKEHAVCLRKSFTVALK